MRGLGKPHHIVLRMLVALALASCAVAAPPPPAAARVEASPGRLAGPPASLRPGVAAYPDVPAIHAAPSSTHQHHHP